MGGGVGNQLGTAVHNGGFGLVQTDDGFTAACLQSRSACQNGRTRHAFRSADDADGAESAFVAVGRAGGEQGGIVCAGVFQIGGDDGRRGVKHGYLRISKFQSMGMGNFIVGLNRNDTRR